MRVNGHDGTAALNGNEGTVVINGIENVIKDWLSFISRVEERLDLCFDNRVPSISIEVTAYKNAYGDFRKRGIKSRVITEITKENLEYCKQLADIVDELRHLEGVRGAMALSETEFRGATKIQAGKPIAQAIASSVKEIVEQQHYVFNTFWRLAVPAKQRINELEKGMIHYETRIVNDGQEILQEMRRNNLDSSQLSICTSTGGLEFSYRFLFDTYIQLLEKQKIGKGKGIRWVTTICEDNLELVRKFLDAGIPMRHTANLPPMNFGISEKEVHVTLEKLGREKRIQNLIVSNEQSYLQTFAFMFERWWESGMDARERIRQIEEGDGEDIEVMPNSVLAKQRYLEMVRSAQREVMLISPTNNAFYRQLDVMGLMDILKEISKRGVHVRILAPAAKFIQEELEHLLYSKPHENIVVRFIQEASDTKATFVIVDKKYSLVTEIKDDSKMTFEEAIGFSIYSSSRPGVLSYVSIFENLWTYSKLYEQIQRVTSMQKEFINIAAHELRTPLQPIIGMAEAIRYGKHDKRSQDELLDLIIKNTSRLQRLAENILDVTRIESQALKLHKESLNLSDLSADIVKDFIYRAESESLGMVRVEHKAGEDIFAEADRARLTQVIINLLNNAGKFTTKGGISITLEKRNSNAVFSVRDSGKGIDNAVLPHLFSKFTHSDTGMGLGLFISKRIIDAHNGKMWAQNNSDGAGATFGFSLPLTQHPGKILLTQ
ncbi:MAG: hypothetical protein KGH88_05945 [Thaumarchaeota archaeon]|nr:hypothetical protein [Nitrososphaerota archaeon]